jgi:hypothetical protein
MLLLPLLHWEETPVHIVEGGPGALLGIAIEGKFPVSPVSGSPVHSFSLIVCLQSLVSCGHLLCIMLKEYGEVRALIGD